jgi:two-component system, chemotaxis family, chemotaxis protein CheY
VNPTALVVDDAATVRMYHASILRGAGFDVVEAANGYEALEVASGRTFEVMLVDVNMPRMDGYALVTAVRREGPNRETPVVMVTTEDDPSDAERGYRCGANVYLPKPVPAARLAAVIALVAGADAS